MRLPLGLGFVLLLTLQSVQQVSTQQVQDDELDNSITTPAENVVPELISGDNLYLNNTGINMTVIPLTSKEPDVNDTVSVTATTPTYTVLNSTSDPSADNNDTSTQTANTSSLTTPGPDLTTPVTNETSPNSTVTAQPDTSTTSPSPGNFSSNGTTVYDQNSTTSDSANSTTTPPQLANTTTASNSSTNETFPTSTTSSNTTTSKTVQLFTTVTTNLNRTAVSFDVRGNSDRGAASDIKEKARNQAWGAIVGVGVAVGVVALVVYVIMKRRNYRDFSHRKLVEDMPPDPVLRLDNSEPLDLKYDGRAYYNPGLQGDNIQMTNFPRGHSN